MGHPRKEVTPEVDYCAFMAAIALFRHKVDGGRYLDAEEIANECNRLPFASDANFRVGPLALHHAFQLFKLSFEKLGVEVIVKKAEGGTPLVMPAFGKLEQFQKALRIKFGNGVLSVSEAGIFPPTGEKPSQLQLMQGISDLKDKVLAMSHFDKSNSLCASSVLLELQRTQPSSAPTAVTTTLLRRGGVELLSPRMQRNHGASIYDMVKARFSNATSEDIVDLLESAVSKAKGVKRKYDSGPGAEAQDAAEELKNDDPTTGAGEADELAREDLLADEEANEEEEEEEEHGGGAEEGEGEEETSTADFGGRLEEHPKVLKVLSEFRQKNNTFTSKDVAEVLSVFDVLCPIIQARQQGLVRKKLETAAALQTKRIVRDLVGYGHLTSNHILRWHRNRNKPLNKKGRKIVCEFEEDVWAEMLLCVMEESAEGSYQVRIYQPPLDPHGVKYNH
jgi:hypothetical protein